MSFGKLVNPRQAGHIALWVGLLWVAGFSVNTANFDTAWTYVYDGGKSASGKTIQDRFNDVKILPNGDALCVGQTQDSAYAANVFVAKLTGDGKEAVKKLHRFKHEAGATALLLAKNGNYVIGGNNYGSPLLLVLDASLNIKASTWYYDSIQDKPILLRGATINSMIESGDGRIITASGDEFPSNNGLALDNYAAYLEFDSQGVKKGAHEWLNTAGFEIAGWSIAESQSDGYLIGGKQSVFDLDNLGRKNTEFKYGFLLPGVGTEINNVSRVHRLRNGSLMVVGQTYEEDCWTRYHRLSYDAWWSPLSGAGADDYRYTAGISGQDDFLLDFTQLIDGRIAFIGGKGTVSDSGLWVFVTDSTGKSVQWEKQYNLPGLVNGSARNNILPLSLAATPDSGFVVVGMEGSTNVNSNAVAFKFVPKPVPVSNRLMRRNPIHDKPLNNAWTFSFETLHAADVELRLFTVQGKMAGHYSKHMPQAGQGEFRVDASQLKAGIYLWEFRVGQETTKGLMTLSE